MKTVFVVLTGEIHEGGEIVSVHYSEKKAIKAALAVRTYFEGGWVSDGEWTWINGCDFVSVEKHRID